MIASLRLNVASLCFKNLSFLRKSHVGLQTTLVVPLLHFSTSTQSSLSVYDFLVHKHHFSPQSASHIASVVTHFTNPQKSDSLLSFLKGNGFSSAQLENALKCWPQLLSRSVDKTVLPRIRIFQEFGFSASDIAWILSNNPWVLNQSVNKMIIPSLSSLKSLFGANGLAKLLKASGAFYFFRSNLNNTLVPNVESLKKCGVSMDQIIWMLHYFPRFVLRKPEDMKKCVDKVDEMGVSRRSKMFMYAVRVVSSLSDETWELKLRNFREVGFSDDELATMFRKQPVVFALSRENVKKTVEVLMANGKYNLSSIANNPTCLNTSIEKRYKPRLQVLELLEGKNLIQRWPALSTLCMTTDKKFYEKYIGPFVDEIGDHASTVKKAASVQFYGN